MSEQQKRKISVEDQSDPSTIIKLRRIGAVVLGTVAGTVGAAGVAELKDQSVQAITGADKNERAINYSPKPINGKNFNEYIGIKSDTFDIQAEENKARTEKLANQRAKDATDSNAIDKELQRFDQQMEELSGGQYQNPEDSTPAGP